MNAMEHGNELPRRPPGDRARAHRRRTACACRSPTTAARPPSREREMPGPRGEARGPAAPARLGPLPDREHGRRGARDERRGQHTVELVLRLEGGGRWRRVSCRAAVRERDGVAVIDLAGDVERARRGGARTRPGRRPRASGADAVVLNFEGAGYINCTGIALIVGLLAQARAHGIAGAGLRADAPLPRDLRDHPAGRLHGDQPRRGQRRARRGREQRCLRRRRRSTCAGTGRPASSTSRGDVTAGSEDVLMSAYDDDRRRARRSSSTSPSSTYMNSGGIGLLVTLLVRANRQRQRLLAFGLSDHYRADLRADPPRRGGRHPRHRGRRAGRGRRGLRRSHDDERRCNESRPPRATPRTGPSRSRR